MFRLLLSLFAILPAIAVAARAGSALPDDHRAAMPGHAGIVRSATDAEAELRVSVTSPRDVSIPVTAGYDGLVFVNYDHDGEQAADQSDCDDEIINGAEDIQDMATLLLVHEGRLEGGRCRILIDEPERLRILDEKDQVVHFSTEGQYYLESMPLAGGAPVIYHVEGVEPGAVTLIFQYALSEGSVVSQCAVRIIVGVEFILTFDDGPAESRGASHADSGHPSRAMPGNPTAMVLEKLKSAGAAIGNRDIKACFFVILDPRTTAFLAQSGDDISSAPSRETDSDRYRAEMLCLMESAGHIFGHHRRIGQVYAGRPDAGLGDDIDVFNAYFTHIGLTPPRFARPPNWIHDDVMDAAYASRGLGLVMSDVRSRDGGFARGNAKPWVLIIRRTIRQATRDRIREGMGQIVYTFHDVNRTTAQNLEMYLRDALKGGKRAGFPEGATIFVNNTERLLNLLEMKVRKNNFAYNRIAQ